MRISDWSSDVCSSDLDRSFLVRIGGGVVGDVHHAAVVEDRRVEARSLLCLVVEPQEGGDLLPDRRHRASPCALNVLQRAGSDRRAPTVDLDDSSAASATLKRYRVTEITQTPIRFAGPKKPTATQNGRAT